MVDPRLEVLYQKWFNKTATPQEKAELLALLEAGASRAELDPLINRIWEDLQETGADLYSYSDKQQLADSILQEFPATPVLVQPAKRVWMVRLAWAAAAVVAVSGSLLLWGLTGRKPATPVQLVAAPASSPSEIQPGRNGAVLTLADGRQILLDSAGNGLIGQQQGAQITLKNDQLVYEGNAIPAGEMIYNIMVTPKGRQFQLLLPDGSRVWLNAASSIRYPVAFTGQERRVEVKGEAYFEIHPDKARPFVVATKQQEVQVLGTSFNVNAYEDEGTERTTLVEGRISVEPSPATDAAAPWQPVLLQQGQQARINGRQQPALTNNQAEAATAWKNGYFNVENMPFDQVMKQLERWYDIQVLYDKGIPNISFVGGLSRNLTLEALIRTLEVSEVHFKMEAGRRLVVYQ
ncbi:MAG: FecR domain-containing protein [Candidatus Pseudobacter hemicellulosilyticus]|uniref:FecR domain-containing protein n=1 Tax=Candidatus Pseudobacter hemicellulosilyticus TaxID=3121375 RepID=A0AAJ5WWS0_9BACT|nr:MAG: FecR domain-containing protein [Pseudobacter sp.]